MTLAQLIHKNSPALDGAENFEKQASTYLRKRYVNDPQKVIDTFAEIDAIEYKWYGLNDKDILSTFHMLYIATGFDNNEYTEALEKYILNLFGYINRLDNKEND